MTCTGKGRSNGSLVAFMTSGPCMPILLRREGRRGGTAANDSVRRTRLRPIRARFGHSTQSQKRETRFTPPIRTRTHELRPPFSSLAATFL